MEEYVGARWHDWITRKASVDYPDQAIELAQTRDQLLLIHRAFGGDPARRMGNSFYSHHANLRNWIQKLAGTGKSWPLASVDDEFVRLPEYSAKFNDISLNHRLYIWLAALAVYIPNPVKNCLIDNQLAVKKLLEFYPGFLPCYTALVDATLNARPLQREKHLCEYEALIEQALKQPGSVMRTISLEDVYPVWMWFYPAQQVPVLPPKNAEDLTHQNQKNTQTQDHRQKTYQVEEVDESDGRSGLMAFRMESLFSWIDFTPVDRTEDDESDVNADAAEDLDKLSISPGATSAKRVRMELDIVSDDEDDFEVEPTEIMLPEWDYRIASLKKDYCCVNNIEFEQTQPCELPGHLRPVAQKLRRQFESLLPQKRWLRRQFEGSEVDMDAWIESITNPVGPDEHGLYRQCRQSHRDISCLLLADLSLSTDSWVGDAGRVIDIVRDSMFLFAEALSSANDRFSLCGFSSRKRMEVYWHTLKTFEQAHDDNVRGRIAQMEPGSYTRMGAAIRNATRLLSKEQSHHRILFLVTDGKPNDLDRYEGRYGIEDTRHALIEARQNAIIPYCVTIDQYARDYLPYIFGKGAFTLVQDPAQLPYRLVGLYAQLTQV